MPPLTLTDLVANRTLSPEMAATLAACAEERRSMLFVAIPRSAGKSTLMHAVLQHAPAETPLHRLSSSLDRLGIPASGDGGYLVVSEVSPAGFTDYLWGGDVREVFAALGRGFALATALHAGGVDEAFDVLTRENGVPADDAARVDVVVYIRSLGHWSRPERRVVALIVETDGLHPGPARVLHRWSESDDRFEAVDPSRRLDGPTVARRLRQFRTI